LWEGVRWPGFAFIEVLSPCITFRPGQAEWKRMVHGRREALQDQRAAAICTVLGDDGFRLGVAFKGARAAAAPPRAFITTLADIEKQFAV
jgi:2-oxoglutarate ferredoxin oxidoreductase subunit beta